MSSYVGVDLGTTNSAICSFDGEQVRIYKSPEQNDVTPSAIFIDKRGHKYVGTAAYNNAPRSPDNAATLFKRMMGTSTPIILAAVDLTMTPEECSAEVLRALFGYLPEDIRNSDQTGTVITVPAAFNQMQKDATLVAAQSAGLGMVGLMQEPVAAVMSVMRKRKSDGIFVIYDLGGGTLDVAIAQSIGGRVSLIGQNGIAMCGGRDFDRKIVSHIVVPWLIDRFGLPPAFTADPKYLPLMRMAAWSAERAKIELSARSEAIIHAGEDELKVAARDGTEIYLDIPITRKQLDEVIAEEIANSVVAARETIEKAGLSSHDIERIVFVGGPTQYGTLREKVASELGIAASAEVNPMTAVAEGAAIFAESIDWSSHRRGRKSSRGTIAAGGNADVTLNYVARTPDTKAKIGIKLNGAVEAGSAFQIDSLDTGWSSGQLSLRDGALVEVALAKAGDNLFKLFVFDRHGGPISLREDRIVIARTAATIDAIPASHSIGIEVRERVGGNAVLEYIVRQGDHLPKSGRAKFKAEESLRSGSSGALKFKLWEGEIAHPISDNRFVGLFEIKGSDFDEGIIAAGAELNCEYSVLDSGNIIIEVSIPSIGGSFASRNLYSRKQGGIDYSSANKAIREDAKNVMNRLRDIEASVGDSALDEAKARMTRIAEIHPHETDPEVAKKAMDELQQVKSILAVVRQGNLARIRQIELDRMVKMFDAAIRKFARPTEESAFDSLARAAQRQIDQSSTTGHDQNFEGLLGDLKSKCFSILWRQDWFVIDRFREFADSPHLFPDKPLFSSLMERGKRALSGNDVDGLRKVTMELHMVQLGSPEVRDFAAQTNLLRG
jgi:molecular chaperone DnaK